MCSCALYVVVMQELPFSVIAAIISSSVALLCTIAALFVVVLLVRSLVDVFAVGVFAVSTRTTLALLLAAHLVA